MWAPDQWKVNKGKIVLRFAVHCPVLSLHVSEYKTILDSGSHFRIPDSSLFQWNLDSRFHSLVGYLSSILDSEVLSSGFHKQKFPWIPHPTSKNFPDSGIRIPLHVGKY